MKTKEEFLAHLRYGKVILHGFFDLPAGEDAWDYCQREPVGLPRRCGHDGDLRCAHVTIVHYEDTNRPLAESEYTVPADWITSSLKPERTE